MHQLQGSNLITDRIDEKGKSIHERIPLELPYEDKLRSADSRNKASALLHDISRTDEQTD